MQGGDVNDTGYRTSRNKLGGTQHIFPVNKACGVEAKVFRVLEPRSPVPEVGLTKKSHIKVAKCITYSSYHRRVAAAFCLNN